MRCQCRHGTGAAAPAVLSAVPRPCPAQSVPALPDAWLECNGLRENKAEKYSNFKKEQVRARANSFGLFKHELLGKGGYIKLTVSYCAGKGLWEQRGRL